MKTIVIAGGGYGGIHLLKGLKREFKNMIGKEIRIILVDRNQYHFRKVLLFKEIIESSDLKIPYEKYCGDSAEFIQGEILSVQKNENNLLILKDGKHEFISYDYLIMALGSEIREVSSRLGGISLRNIESARMIRKQIFEKLNEQSGKRLLNISIVGAGITGIETAASIADWLRKETGFVHNIVLINSEGRLLPLLPKTFAKKIEKQLGKLGIRVEQGKRVERYVNERIEFRDHSAIPADICIWTNGMIPNPLIGKLGFKTDCKGSVTVNSFYQIEGESNIYALGDNALIRDPKTGEIAGMTCKEAIDQAGRLSKIMKQDLKGKQKLSHKYHFDFYCISLGNEKGIVWMKQFGLNFFITGRLGGKIRQLTWDLASIIRR
ncbi:NAD(P)/FAD-dependent oxidoreductase [Metabacillus fastidiosus]|uniref:NAD(P)/FAD-dependent oxidoreductase n=1 Tax=Metabacillus fastidiosus TaxID=1458 RepID=UPI002E1AA794|nr:FAD-dependent oxidoreductase [Metabacillus fastidiosus]MED4453616.1 FAD-dependent oxidoreductase [Metabacillus fastidiosus]